MGKMLEIGKINRLLVKGIAGYGIHLDGGESGDILFYGCNIADDSDGLSLLNEVAELTGGDVAASDDMTGHADLNADWELEYKQGEIETTIAVSSETQNSWSNVLVNFSVDNTADTNDVNPGNGILRVAITISRTFFSR